MALPGCIILHYFWISENSIYCHSQLSHKRNDWKCFWIFLLLCSWYSIFCISHFSNKEMKRLVLRFKLIPFTCCLPGQTEIMELLLFSFWSCTLTQWQNIIDITVVIILVSLDAENFKAIPIYSGIVHHYPAHCITCTIEFRSCLPYGF